MLLSTVVLALSVTMCRGQETPAAPPPEIIMQIRNQTVYLQNNATLLLNTFLRYQEMPFSSSGFGFPFWQEAGLPTASLSYKKWRCLCSGDRLLLARNAFSIISDYFQLVQDDQLSLNPGATDLHQLLEAARVYSEAVLRNLITAFETLGFQPPPVQLDTLNWKSTGATTFQKKVRGYILCREYKDWLSRVTKDMEILNGTLRGRPNFHQDRKECCRS